MNVPSFSLTRQNEKLKDRIGAALSATIDKGMFILGEIVKLLEAEIAACCGAEAAIGVANGSDALYLALLGCGIGPGDEVITTPFTFFATGGSIRRTGARPVFADIEPDTWNIDPQQIEDKITEHTRAIMPVHLYGCPVDLDRIMDIARKNNLPVIEDAAQAIGAAYRGRPIGSTGDAVCFSFFPTKNLGAFGDAGMVVTGNPEIAEQVRILRVHGARPKYYHQILGINSRLDEVQAAILRVKREYLDGWTRRRREIASLYNHLLGDLNGKGLKLPVEPDYASHVYHQYTVQVDRRDELQGYLKERGVGATVYYPLPLHLQKVFADLGYKAGDFPVSEQACREVLSLPMFPELTDEEVEYVGEVIGEFFKS
ncbi:MAG: DegT/DnrJ/EryC1/StrS family aminotransferase [Dethiobacteria bacterium]